MWYAKSQPTVIIESPVRNENAFRYENVPFFINFETTNEAKEWQQ